MTPLHFAAHLFAVAVALGAAIVLSRDRTSPVLARIAGAMGFMALATGEAVVGAAFAADLDLVPGGLRTAGYGLLFLGALGGTKRPVEREEPVAVVVLALPILPAAVPAAFAGAAALAVAVRRRRAWGVIPLATGLGVLALAEAALEAAPEATVALRPAGYLGVAWFVIRSVRSSISLRFASAMVGLLVAVVVAVSSVVSSVLGGSLRNAAFDRVARQAEAAAGELEPLVAQEAGGLGIVAKTTIRQFRRQSRFSGEQMRALKDSLFHRTQFLLFLTGGGRILGRTGLSEGQAVEATAVGQFALESEVGVASLDSLGAKRLVLIGAAPVRDRGEVLGVAMVGYFVDQALLERVIAPGNLGAAFRRADPVPVAAKEFNPPAVTASVDPAILRDIWEGFLSGEGTEQRNLSVAGQETFAALTPLRRSDGKPVGILLVAEKAEAVTRTQGNINRVLFAATLVLFFLAFLLAALVARRITRPVISLTGAARRVAAGELEAKAEVKGQDEVGDLAAAFNQMTESLAISDAQLREAAEEEARLRGRLETVVNSMGDGLIAADHAGSIVTYNPAAAAILGRARESVVGRPLGQVLEIRNEEGRPIPLGRALPPGTAFIERPDRRQVPVAIVSSPLRDSDGRRFGQVLVLRDMTREHEVERMKTEILSNVSHELRTPLTPIIGYAEILSDREVPGERVQQFAVSMLSSAHRLERIVAMLVDFAAMGGGRMAIEAEPTSLRPLVQRAVEEWQGRSDRHRFVTKFDPGVPQAVVDVGLMRRAIDEVLDNAVKYSPQGGTVTVSLSPENSQRPMLRLEVRDEGIGIEPTDLPRIFEDFRQLDASDTRSFGGLGLGLAFVKRIVDAHRGTITAESSPGQGTTFRLLLPAADKEG